MARPSKQLFAINLRTLLQKTGKRQSKLAEHLKVDPSTISHWLKARNSPGVEILSDIADYLGVPVTRFFIDPEDPSTTGIDIDTALHMVTEAIKKKSK